MAINQVWLVKLKTNLYEGSSFEIVLSFLIRTFVFNKEISKAKALLR